MQVILFPFSSNSPIFLRSLNRLIHTICFIFNLIFQFFQIILFLHFLIGYVATTVQFQILTIISLIMDLRCTHCLHLLTLLKSNPNLCSPQPSANVFHMLLLCNCCHIYFNYAYFLHDNYISVCVVLFLLTNPLFL